MNASTPQNPQRPNWRQVGLFLTLTFGLTWLLDLALYLRGGLSIPGIAIFSQLQTLLPAFSVSILGLYLFRESPLHPGQTSGRGRWFYLYFTLMTLLYGLAALNVFLSPSQSSISLAATLLQVLVLLGLGLLLALRFVAGREAMARVGLSWGKLRYWLLFGLGFVAFYALQAVLNAFTGMGGSGQIPPSIHSPLQLILAGVQTVLLVPLLAILVYFGEEYGWRGYLQSKLVRLGRVRGVLLVGLIWGAWHWPLILMGLNYPGHPLLGIVLNTLNTTALAVILGYAVLKSGSVLLAAYLHGITDQIINFLVALGFRPHDPAFSFGIGIYGIVMLAVIALVILRDPVWRAHGPRPGSLAPAQPDSALSN